MIIFLLTNKLIARYYIRYTKSNLLMSVDILFHSIAWQ